MAETAANALQLSPGKALELKVVDGVIAEPVGGAHRHPDDAIARVKDSLVRELAHLQTLTVEKMLEGRFQKFRQMGNSTLLEVKDAE